MYKQKVKTYEYTPEEFLKLINLSGKLTSCKYKQLDDKIIIKLARFEQ